MQTQETTEAETTHTALASAEAKLEKLRAAAAEADAVAERAATAYAKERTGQHLIDKQVTADKATDAHMAATAFEQGELGTLRAERNEALRQREEEALRSMVRRIGEAVDGASTAVNATGSALESVLATIREFDVLRQRSRFGVSMSHAQIGVLLAQLNNAIKLASGAASVRWVDHGNSGTLILELTMPAFVPSVLRG